MSRYIGARYVPIMGGAWDNTQEYEPLTVVQYEGDSYTSKMYVPVGVAITNTTYWVKTGNFNQQLSYLNEHMQDAEQDIDDIQGDINDLSTSINNLSSSMLGVKTIDFTNTSTDSMTAGAYKTLTFTAANDNESELYQLIHAQYINAESLLTGTGGSAAVPVGFAYIVAVKFSPAVPGLRQATLSFVVHNSESQTITLTGGTIKLRYLDVAE